MRFWCYLMEWNMIKLAQLSRTHRRIVSMVQVSCLCHEFLVSYRRALRMSRTHESTHCPDVSDLGLFSPSSSRPRPLPAAHSPSAAPLITLSFHP
jgi:hypothetical protein